MKPLLIKGGRVIDPSRNFDGRADLLIRDGRIAAVEPAIAADAADVIDATGLLVVPGLVDLHVHLRTPGQEWKEDMVTGTRAAAAGGFTRICCMPNTDPVIDSGPLVEALLRRIAREAVVHVHPLGAVTVGQEGERLTEIGELAAAGVVALSDDGRPVMNGAIMRAALAYARMFDLPVVAHEEDRTLAAGGVMHFGAVSSRLGLPGMPAEAEAAMVARDLLLAEATGGHLHVAHVSTAASVALIRQAKEMGVPVTAEVTPHHLLLTDELVWERSFDTNTKVNPPLRTEADREALLEGLRDGTIDCIATDHAPHHVDEKEVDYREAAFGISGLETAVGIVFGELVGSGLLDPVTAVARMSYVPAQIFGLPGGSLRPGEAADLTLIEPGRSWRVEPDRWASKGKNTPLAGRTLRARPLLTLVGGRTVYDGRDER